MSTKPRRSFRVTIRHMRTPSSSPAAFMEGAMADAEDGEQPPFHVCIHDLLALDAFDLKPIERPRKSRAV